MKKTIRYTANVIPDANSFAPLMAQVHEPKALPAQQKKSCRQGQKASKTRAAENPESSTAGTFKLQQNMEKKVLDRGDCVKSGSNEGTFSGHQGTSYPLPVLEDGATVTFNTNACLSSGLDEAVGRQHQEVDPVVASTQKTMLKQEPAKEDFLKMSTSAQLKIGEAEMDRAGIKHSLDPHLKSGDPSSSSSSNTGSGST